MVLSKKDKAQLIVIGVGLVLMISIGYTNFKKIKSKKEAVLKAGQTTLNNSAETASTGGKKESAPPAANSKPTTITSVINASEKSVSRNHLELSVKKEKLLAQKSLMDRAWGRDPFFDSPKQEVLIETIDPVPQIILPAIDTDDNEGAPLSRMILKGVSRVGQKYIAMINRDICQVGDIIEGYQIEEILQNRIILNKDGKRYEKFIQ